jgi:hypothetical protein
MSTGLYLVTPLLILTPPYVRQGAPFWRRCSITIKIDRHTKIITHSLSETIGQSDAIIDGYSFDRYQRTYIGGADPWMLPYMLIEVNQSRGFCDGLVCPFFYRIGLANKGDYSSIVILIRTDI